MWMALEDRFARLEIVTRAEILADGGTDRWIRAAVSSGEIIRIRQGIFCRPGLDAATHTAVRVGGRLDCVTELERLGVWMIPRHVVHVQLAPTAGRLRGSPDAVMRHWRSPRTPPSRTHVGAIDALSQAAGCLPRRELVAALDSALRLGLLDLDDIQRTEPLRRHITLLDPSAESGLESMLRLLLRDLGLRVRTQELIPGIGRVDLLIEDRVIVEADGDAHHGSRTQRARDRSRDAAAVGAGYGAHRYGYEQIVGRPETVARAVINAVRTHRGVRNAGRIARRAQGRLDTRRVS